jgi:DNA-binding NarL/FixJ family response regulator
VWQRLGNRRGVALCLVGLAAVAAGEGRWPAAARLCGAVERLADGLALESTDRGPLDRTEASVRAALDAHVLEHEWRAGMEMTLDEAVAEALGSRPATGVEAGVVGAATPSATPEQLSARERQVAALVAQGITNREIAERLSITEGTAINHVTHILTKLGMRSRAQIAVWAVERGM